MRLDIKDIPLHAIDEIKEFRENRYSGSHAVLSDVNEVSCFLHSPSDLDKILYVRYTRDAFDQL